MKVEKQSTTPVRRWALAAALLAVVLAGLFFRSFLPGFVHFNNDGPLGQQSMAWVKAPQGIRGMWADSNYIGFDGGVFSPDVTLLLRWFLGPVGLGKFLVPISLFILSFGAWLFFTQLRLSRLAALVGALAVALNSAYLSTACWGVAPQQIAYGFDFMALALVVGITAAMPLWSRWARIILAGMAVGMNVMEAADIGALMSIFIASFVGWHAWVATEEGVGTKLFRVGSRLAVLAVSAGFIAAFAVAGLIGTTQIKSGDGAEEDAATKQAHWDFATQWSFPKRETLALVIPGLYGFRMDTAEGGNYWGVGGRDPVWWRYIESGRQGPPPDPNRYIRQAGGGCYMGVTAVLLAFWAAFQAFQKNSVFSDVDRKLIWFFTAALGVSLLLAYGRYAPFFQFVYAIPYASSIRNPGKFLASFTFALTVLTAYGIHGLSRSSLEIPFAGPNDLGVRLKSWWAKASSFDRRWTTGCLAVVGLSVAGWFIYWRSQPSLEQYLQTVQFDEILAPRIAEFSIRQVGWFVLFLSLGVGLVTVILSGAFAGRRARTGGILLGLLIVADLGRADLPWIKYIDYAEKYASNPVLDKLREQPYEHRVAILPFRAPPEYGLFDQMYRIEWAQHHFPYYNIQSLDVIQLPRVPADLAAFETALAGDGTSNTAFRVSRRWELTNTRYLLGAAGFLDVLNQQLDPEKHRFRIAATFDFVPKPGVVTPMRYEELTAAFTPGGSGKYALFEFTGALPRAKLYSNWQVNTNDQATLQIMGSASFDPAQSVLAAGGKNLTSANPGTNSPSGTVAYESYAATDIKLKTQSATATVLLLNDKFDPKWRVAVDGQPAELLRCNFLMRGVALPAGAHTVEFTFKADLKMLYVSLAATALGVGLLGLVLWDEKSRRAA